MPRFVALATFATVNAAMQRGTPRDVALQSAGIPPATWEASLAFWLGRMAEEAAQQRFGLSQRYSLLYAEAQGAPQSSLLAHGLPAPAAHGHTPSGPTPPPSSVAPSRAPAPSGVTPPRSPR